MDSLNKAFFFAKLFGYFPFSFGTYGVTAPKKLVAYSILVKAFFASGPFLYALSLPIILNPNTSKLYLATLLSMITISSLFNFLAFGRYIYNRPKLETILKNYNRADDIFMGFGIIPKANVRFGVDCLILLYALSASLLWLYGVRNKLSLQIAFLTYYGFQLGSSVYMTIQPFIRVLDNLRKRMNTARIIFCRLYRYHDPRKNEKLMSVLELLEVLCSTTELLNEIFSLEILYTFVMGFYTIISFTFYSKHVFNAFIQQMPRVMVASYYFLYLIVIVAVCSKTSEEVCYFGYIDDIDKKETF